MTAQTPTLTDFLLARIAEDEAVAKLAAEDDYTVAGGLRWGEVGYETSPDLTINPARVLAECEAKRRIVEMHVNEGAADGLSYCGTCEDRRKHDAANWPCDTIRSLALPYASHPDYNPDWRP